jgi:hypothetical protein
MRVNNIVCAAQGCRAQFKKTSPQITCQTQKYFHKNTKNKTSSQLMRGGFGLEDEE